ncbi:MAG: response regulator transcription factor [Oscillospiraceae bacterium]
MANILVAEDEVGISRVICKNLELVGHSPYAVFDGEDTVRISEEKRFDLALLDVMLPKQDGFSVKEHLPSDLPVIFVTAKTALSDKLKGLGLGAEDYIVKPFEILELLARVQTVLRRTGKTQSVFNYRTLSVDLCAHRVFLSGEEIALAPQEFNLLETLIINRNIALSRERLLSAAWGYDYEGETRTVDNHIQRLRKKLNLEDEIQTVYKLGYRLSIREDAMK